MRRLKRQTAAAKQGVLALGDHGAFDGRVAAVGFRQMFAVQHPELGKRMLDRQLSHSRKLFCRV